MTLLIEADLHAARGERGKRAQVTDAARRTKGRTVTQAVLEDNAIGHHSESNFRPASIFSYLKLVNLM